MAKQKITPEIIEQIREAKKYNKIGVVAAMFDMSKWKAGCYCRGIETVLRPEVIESVIADYAAKVALNDIAAKHQISRRNVYRLVGHKVKEIEPKPFKDYPESEYFDYELCGPAFF